MTGYKKWIFQTYGLTREKYDEMLLEQSGKCAICGGDVDLEIDHDHETGKVRGLLCGNCNKALGLIKDNPETALELYTYIRYFEKIKNR